jgi:hypothetical protein
MAECRVGEGMASFDASYQEYVINKKLLENTRYRGPGETIFEALLSDEADFTKDPDSKEIVKLIQDYK